MFYVAALAASLLPALLSAYLVWQVRTTDYKNGATSALNIAKLIANGFENSFDQIDALLLSISRQYADGVEGGQQEKSRLAQLVQEGIGHFPFVARIFAADATGRIVAGGGVFNTGPNGADVSDRPYFKRAAEGDRGLIFEGPIRAEFADGWVVVLSRRVETQKGEFLGVVAASIPVESFEKRFAAVDLFRHGVLVFRNMKGLQIARYSLETNERGYAGDPTISAALRSILREHPELDHTIYETLAPQDQVQRFYAYQKLSRAPFFLLVGWPKAVLDHSWRQLAIELGALCLGATIVSLWIARSLHASALSLDDERRLLEQRVADRTRELEANNSDLVQAGEEIRRLNADLEQRVAIRTRQLVEARSRAEAASQAKSAFLANMSHEIRTPMNTILGATHLLQKELGQRPERDRLVHIDRAAQHLLALIDDILDLSKIESGRLELEQRDFDLGQLLGDVASIIGPGARAKGLRFDIEADHVPDRLIGDVTRLRQALLNYANNALKFTESGFIIVRALLVRPFLTNQRDDQIFVRFEVEDSGEGVDSSVLPHLFSVFQQADVSTTRKHGGTGLGLVITRRLAEAMGGEAGAESEPGVGSTFWFTAHLKKSTGAGAKTERKPSADVVTYFGARKHRRVLFVEDNEINREVAGELLRSEGLIVETAKNGLEALEKAQASIFDLILMDMQMPVMGGLDATREIRKMAGWETKPIIALTANVFEEDRRACLEAGMNDFLTKPFNPVRLYATVARWLPDVADASERAPCDPATD